MDYKLKNCPCCGGQAHLDREDIFCDCGIKIDIYPFLYGGEAKDYEEAKQIAIDTWNERVNN